MLTGAGGAALPFLIGHLRGLGHRVVAADMDPMAPGFWFADSGVVLPAATDSAYFSTLRAICIEKEVEVVIPLVDEELISVTRLEEDGIRVLCPEPSFVSLCLDKWLFSKRMMAEGLPCPRTVLFSDGPGDLAFPLVLKPRVGRGSRGVAYLDSMKALERALAKNPLMGSDYILQECVDGPEYTVSVVQWRDGVIQAVVPKRVMEKKGVTRHAVTEKLLEIDSIAQAIQARIGAFGPFNIQLRVCRHSNKPMIFEINPRFSSSISLTIAAGVDEVGLLIEQALGRRQSEHIPWHKGVAMVRHMHDQILRLADWESHKPVPI